MKPLISVIIPVYNVEQYLVHCVNSVIKQDYANLEIILVNDGSTDHSKQICENIKEQDSRVIVVHKENGGLSDARNTGIEIAKGEYIFFLDSDDYIRNDTLSLLYERIQKDNSDIALCNYEYVDENGEKCKESVWIDNDIWDKSRFWKENYGSKRVFCVIACNKLYKAHLLRTVRFPVKKLHEDEFILFDIIDQCQKISIVSDRCYYYLQRTNSITGSINSSRLLDAAEAHILRSIKFQQTKSQKLAETALVCSIAYLLKAQKHINKTNKALLLKYKTVKKMYNKSYWSICNAGASLRFILNAFTFIPGAWCYTLTHYGKLKE